MGLGSLAKQYYKALIIGAGVAVLYSEVLRELAFDWWNNPDYSHGLLLPFVTLYLIWQKKGKLAGSPAAPSKFGLMVMLGSLGLLFAGHLGAEFFISRVSLLLFLGGLVLFFFGWKHLRMVSFPLGLLFLAIPLPAVIFYQLTFPLQLIASQLATFFLETSMVPVLREGNVIVLPNITLEVVEACSGIRSLFSLMTLTILYGYFMEGRTSFRLILIAMTVPLALFCNGLRIMGTGILTQYVNPAAAEGFFHSFSGWIIFLIAFASLFVIHRGLQLFKRPERKEDDALAS
ncbi:MAG: exosortase [Acidobacteria bacterium]|nr:exosortase [Acidobacteriota bacterium]